MVAYIFLDSLMEHDIIKNFEENYLKNYDKTRQWLDHQGIKSNNWATQDYQLFHNRFKLRNWINNLKTSDELLVFNHPPINAQRFLMNRIIYLIETRTVDGIYNYHVSKIES